MKKAGSSTTRRRRIWKRPTPCRTPSRTRVADTVPADSIVTTVTDTIDSAGEAVVAAGEDGDDSNTGLIIAAIVLGVAVIFGAGYFVMRRGKKDDTQDGPTPGTTPTDTPPTADS